jgi:hypothetical protein
VSNLNLDASALGKAYLLAEARGQRGALFWIEASLPEIPIPPQALIERQGTLHLLYWPDCTPEQASDWARKCCEAARAAKQELALGLALSQTQPLFFETLLQVAREGSEVARHQGRCAWAHTELYDLHQRALARAHPDWNLPTRGQAPALASAPAYSAEPAPALAPPAAPRPLAEPASIESAPDERVQLLERRLAKLVEELQARERELEALRQEQQRERGLPSLWQAEPSADPQRLALFAQILQQNLVLQQHYRRAN